MPLSLSDDPTVREKQLSTEALRIPPVGLLPLAVTLLTQVPPAEQMPRLSPALALWVCSPSGVPCVLQPVLRAQAVVTAQLRSAKGILAAYLDSDAQRQAGGGSEWPLDLTSSTVAERTL